MARLVGLFNRLLQSKQLEGLWGNPIRAGHDPNPFYGLEKPLMAKEHTSEHARHRSHSYNSDVKSLDSTTDASSAHFPPWEAQGRTRLMDCGMANNLPNHVLARPERAVDIFISFDSSSDVQTGAAVQRLHHWAADFDFELQEETDLFDKHQKDPGIDSDAGSETEARYLDQYARVFRGTRQNGHEVYVVYCPLLPNGNNPDYNPAVSFRTSHR